MTDRKTEFWWASIHGADPEPVEKTEHEGRPCVYTLGCADPFYLDEAPCAVLFVSADGGIYWPKMPGHKASYEPGEAEPMERPLHPDKDRARQAALSAARRRQAAHSWRGPR